MGIKKIVFSSVCALALCGTNALAAEADETLSAGAKSDVVTSEDKPAVDGEDKPAVDGEDKPAVDGEDKPAVDGEDKPAVDGEDKPATDSDTTPDPEVEKKVAEDVKKSLGGFSSLADKETRELVKVIMDNGGDASKMTAEQKAKVEQAANKIAAKIIESKKSSVNAEALSTLNVQINNMNKRMGELRGLDGEAGAWVRTWGGRMSGEGIDSFNYYSTQIGADKKSSLKGGDLYLGVLAGFDKVNANTKSKSYSGGIYGSYISNSGFFADGVLKFVKTSHDSAKYDIDNQTSFLASIEGGYRVSVDDAFYVEPSVEFITGRISEYKSKSKKDKTTVNVDAFSPVVFKPQVFVGGNVDNFTYRAGVGGVLTPKAQKANLVIDEIVTGINAKAETKLDKNNHGFVNIGGSYKINNNLRLNVGVERGFGGKLKNDYELNATIRYSF